MDCVDVSLALSALVGVSLIIAGSRLMINPDQVSSGFGSFSFALGFLIVALAASGNNAANVDLKSRRYLIALGSVVAIVAGTFMTFYHIKNKIRSLLSSEMVIEEFDLREEVINSIPSVDNLLIYVGYIGLVVAIALRDDNSFNLVKGALAAGAILVVSYTKKRMVEATIVGGDVEKTHLAHILSYGLLVLAIAYKC